MFSNFKLNLVVDILALFDSFIVLAIFFPKIELFPILFWSHYVINLAKGLFKFINIEIDHFYTQENKH